MSDSDHRDGPSISQRAPFSPTLFPHSHPFQSRTHGRMIPPDLSGPLDNCPDRADKRRLCLRFHGERSPALDPLPSLRHHMRVMARKFKGPSLLLAPPQPSEVVSKCGPALSGRSIWEFGLSDSHRHPQQRCDFVVGCRCFGVQFVNGFCSMTRSVSHQKLSEHRISSCYGPGA